ncbi:hypothetical protein JTB14_020025 [Gonioctena quinquepunctata]|nr:hypothetical protein JTB14_020025 [Gonioctena quinquepunctata]
MKVQRTTPFRKKRGQKPKKARRGKTQKSPSVPTNPFLLRFTLMTPEELITHKVLGNQEDKFESAPPEEGVPKPPKFCRNMESQKKIITKISREHDDLPQGPLKKISATTGPQREKTRVNQQARKPL